MYSASRRSTSLIPVSGPGVESGAELGAEARGDLGDVVLAHPLDPVANLARGEPAEHVQLDHAAGVSR